MYVCACVLRFEILSLFCPHMAGQAYRSVRRHHYRHQPLDIKVCRHCSLIVCRQRVTCKQ